MKTLYTAIACLAIALPAAGQQPVAVGSGSYAEYAPLYKSKTDEHGGDKSRIMETRKIYVSERKQGEPVPTNDWWTNLLVDTYSGVLWTYPQVVKAEGYGIFVSRPNHWSSDGCEMKYDTKITVKGRRFRPKEAIADDWSDWGLRMQLPDGEKRMNVTMAQGVPFTWVEPENLELLLNLGGGELLSGGNPVSLPVESDRLVVRIGEDHYGIFAPDGTLFSEADGDVSVTFAEGKPHYLSIGILPDAEACDFYARYSAVVPRHTSVAWSYDERSGKMTSRWHIESENLDEEPELSVLQGFMPHHYKKSELDVSFTDYSYATPRGKMKMAATTDFSTAYHFSGMLPWVAAPEELSGLSNPYDRERMKQLISDYAAKGGFGADTYWGGKGLIQMALYMTFAKETGEDALFEQCRSRLRAAMENWLTYTPGEQSFFFARNGHWGALVGYDTSYDSDTFNDHHFHYGYFTYAGALLALVDSDFRDKYGDMLRLIAKDYANWDRNDKRFPLFRTFCPWSGHSYAGGLGNTGNGNGQESTSEAMQGWGGMYLLGVALGDKEMRDAGIFGWVTESKGIAEYWFDRDKENINRDLYKKPYNSNLTAAGIGWWTWFSGDPVWMHSIQWMPISPCLDYLSEDLEFARWDYEQMWAGKEIGGWEPDPGYAGSALSKEAGLGNVVLSYLQRFDPDQAAKVFDEMWEAGTIVARSTDTNGITYYITHSHRTYGDRDFGLNADIPTSSAYKDAEGEYTYVVYNPESAERTVTFYRDGVKEKSFVAPARRLTVYQEAPVAASVAIASPKFRTVEPGQTLPLEAKVLDQYGAEMAGAAVEWSVSGEGCTVDSDGTFHAGTRKLGSCTVKAAYGTLESTLELRIDDAPYLSSAEILPATDFAMAGQTVVFTLEAKDQYGERYPGDYAWTIEKDGKTVKQDSILDCREIGVYKVSATSGGHVYSREIYMTPQMDNLASGCVVEASSEENVGLLCSNLTDGDLSTRWSSKATDDEWIYVDLGKRSFVNSVRIHWEAAYATLYDVDVSDNGTDWQTIAEANGSEGVQTVEIGVSTRFFRISGKGRATAFGYSIWEMEVYGIDPDTDPTALMGIEIVAPGELLKEGEPVELSVRGFDGSGRAVEIGEVEWAVDPSEGTVGADGVYVPEGYGKTTVTATASGKTASKEFVVEESIKPHSAEILPKKAELAVGETLEFGLEATDQFSTGCSADGFVFSCPMSPESLSGNVFTAREKGTFEVIASNGKVTATASVKVGASAEVNLALGKDVYASSYENDSTVPENVNDGDLSTRWGSGFEDDQFITVDLGAAYVLNRVVIHWNADAYSTAYRVEVSENDEDWTVVGSLNPSAGGVQTHEFGVTAGRYVRIYCEKRANAYGSCIDELEIYGTSRYEDPEPVEIQFVGNESQVAFVGEPLKMEVRLTDRYGIDCTGRNTVDWQAEGDCAEISSEGVLNPLKEGTCVVTASCGSLSAAAQVGVKAARRTGGLSISPASPEVEAGTAVRLEAQVFDQYGLPLPEEPVVWSCAAGEVADGTFVADTPGDYEISAACDGYRATATVKVIAPLTENIALNKPVEVSSGDSGKASVNDGNEGSRWIAEGKAEDEEWVVIDLEGCYHLMRSRVVWERAAAADYEMQTSVDGETWIEIDSRSGLEDTGGTRIDDATVDGVGRYVRLRCLRRATQWAYSIYEWELYGRKMEAGEPCRIEVAVPSTVDVGATVRLTAKVTDCNGAEVSGVPVVWRATGGIVEADGDYRCEIVGDYEVVASAGLVSATAGLAVTDKTSGMIPVSGNGMSLRVEDGNTLVVETDGKAIVAVYSVTGSRLLSYGVPAGGLRRQLSLNEGIYLVEVVASDVRTVEKVAISR